jgi:hypothetical protein
MDFEKKLINREESESLEQLTNQINLIRGDKVRN